MIDKKTVHVLMTPTLNKNVISHLEPKLKEMKNNLHVIHGVMNSIFLNACIVFWKKKAIEP